MVLKVPQPTKGINDLLVGKVITKASQHIQHIISDTKKINMANIILTHDERMVEKRIKIMILQICMNAETSQCLQERKRMSSIEETILRDTIQSQKINIVESIITLKKGTKCIMNLQKKIRITCVLVPKVSVILINFHTS